MHTLILINQQCVECTRSKICIASCRRWYFSSNTTIRAYRKNQPALGSFPDRN